MQYTLIFSTFLLTFQVNAINVQRAEIGTRAALVHRSNEGVRFRIMLLLITPYDQLTDSQYCDVGSQICHYDNGQKTCGCEKPHEV